MTKCKYSEPIKIAPLVSYIEGGERIYLPDEEILDKNPGHKYYALKGYGFCLAVRYKDKWIGWMDIETLGYTDVKQWMIYRDMEAKNG